MGLIYLLFPRLEPLVLYGLYSVPSNSFLAIPNEPALLWAQTLVGALLAMSPLVLATVGACGAAAAATLDYAVIGAAFDLPRLDALRQKRLFQAAVSAFNRWPFLTVLAFALLPAPFYIVRVLAPNSGYPLRRYTLAVTLGRFGRYLVVASVGRMFSLPTWVLAGILAVAIAAAAITPAVGWWRSRRTAAGPAQVAGATGAAGAEAGPAEGGP
jgi:membrane protein YqaA with SNARE-associated domain